ncbi:MAG: hypothetical protein HYV75_03385 [Opitutae bacterium]|nr:hypothetical protein [Opitutae bacterium]
MPASLLHRFRSDRKHLPLHPLERAVLTVVALHLCFLPWALGTMHVWSQLTSLSLSLITFTLALIPRTYSGDNLPAISPQVCSAISAKPPSGFFASVSRSENRGQTPAGQQAGTAKFQVSPRATSYRLSPLPRLLKFPLFWIGLALLGYIVLQALNPSWVWERNATTWWLRRVNDIPWLPTSIDTPFERFNLWRQFIIYASAWLTVCTVWVGFTRRRSLQLLLTILVINATVLAGVGFLSTRTMPAPGWRCWRSCSWCWQP